MRGRLHGECGTGSGLTWADLLDTVRNILLVGLGGFVGSAARYTIAGALQSLTTSGRFPLGTLGVNVIGCFAIGLLAGWAESIPAFSPSTRLLLMVGLLGGFTTFSSFGYETVEMLRNSRPLLAFANVALQVGLGLPAVWLGLTMTTPT